MAFFFRLCVLVGGDSGSGGGGGRGLWGSLQLSQLRIFDQRLHPPATPHPLSSSPPHSLIPLPFLESSLRLIKLDQDDTNNWLKLGPVRRPNDPYLTPFVAMVSLFPRRAPFGMVYLGSVTSVLAQSPAEHNSPLTSWERRKGYIFRRCLGNYRRARFLWSPNSSLLFNIPQGRHTHTYSHTEDEVFRCEMFPLDINIHDFRGGK